LPLEGTSRGPGLKNSRLGFLSDQNLAVIEPKIVETEKVLNGLIKALREG
jgi:hypothetical protein